MDDSDQQESGIFEDFDGFEGTQKAEDDEGKTMDYDRVGLEPAGELDATDPTTAEDSDEA